MFSFIKNCFKSKEIRSRLLFTFFIFAIFRLGSHIPVPFVNAKALNMFQDVGFFGLLNMFGGGALQRFSIFALGVSPYITASIIMQLLQMDLVPKFTEWAKQGEVGRRKLNQWTTYIGIILGFAQAYGLAYGFNRMSGSLFIKDPTVSHYLTIALILTAGTMFLVWLGEQITRNGVGNGLSMIIFAGIVAQVPSEVIGYSRQYLINDKANFERNLMIALAVIAVLIILIVVVVVMERAQRRLPIHHSKKSSSAKVRAHLPLKINSAGVIPVIFATSFITTPQMIFAYVFTGEQIGWRQFLLQLFDIQHPYGAIFFTVLLIGFTYYYSLVQVNPEKVAENLQKQSAYIPSVRPGADTEVYLTKIINRLSGVGALYLAVIATLPIIAGLVWNIPRLSLGGTSLLIVVGVAIETAKQIEGRLVKRRYKGFLYL